MKSSTWTDYQIIATGDGQKLERWGEVILLRPDPQVIWPSSFKLSSYKGLNAVYKRSKSGGGYWEKLKPFPDEWVINYKDLRFLIKPMGFKHTGLFPEQSINWDIMRELIGERLYSQKLKPLIPATQTTPPQNKEAFVGHPSSGGEFAIAHQSPTINNHSPTIAHQPSIINHHSSINILNLFAYTGGASVACAKAGARVTHVDAAKGMVDRAAQNAKLSGTNIRLIIDDCFKFVQREIKRGNKYDAVIMDLPSFGRGPNGEMWKIEDNLFELVTESAKVLSDNPLFFLINSYTTGLQPTVIQNILSLAMKDYKGSVAGYELTIPTDEGIYLPCGCSGIWRKNAERF